MSAHDIDVNPIIDAIPGREVPRSVVGIAAAGILFGTVTFGLCAWRHPEWAWGAFLVALVYTLAIAQGGVLFSVMMTLTWGRWGRPIKRIGESFAAFLPVGYLLLAFFLIAGNKLYPWNPHTFVASGPIGLAPHADWAISTKSLWLSLPFFAARQLVGFAVLITLDWLYLRASFGPDLAMAAARLKTTHPEFTPPGWWSLLGYSPTADAAAGQQRQTSIAPLIGFCYAIVFSLVAFDLIMSLSPLWYSNMFGAWFFMTSFWLSLAALGIYSLLSRDWLGITAYVSPNVTHDLGKLCLALCMFWAYTLYAQILPIWYAQMPEETQFLLIRMKPEMHEWNWLAQVVIVMCFLAPFSILTSRGIKKMKWPFIGVLSVIMIGVFLERTLLVMPSVWFERHFPFFLFATVSLGQLWSFGGMFVLLSSHVLSKVPAMVVSDPFLAPHPWDVHVHAAGEPAHH